MKSILIAENISKQYRLGVIGTGNIRHDLKRWWYLKRGKEDPFIKIGEKNRQDTKASGDYVWALKDINFEVKPGEILGIIGKNGAGKSTLLKILSRITAPTTGSIEVRGRISSLLEVGTGFHRELTGRENIFMNGAVLGMTKREIKTKLDEIIDFSGCERYIDTPVKRYSSGMTVRLGFAVAAHLEPDILVVDEVLAVGDAEFQKKAIGKMNTLSSDSGRTILFVSHNMDAVKSLCQRGLVLHNGEVDFAGEARESVDHYLSNYRRIPQIQNKINESHRRHKNSRALELLSISSSHNDLHTRSRMCFDVLIRKNKNITFPVCLTGTIMNFSDMEIGSFFSEEIYVHQEESTINLTIADHNLAPGSYYINLTISKGSLKNAHLSEVDHAFEAISFEIEMKERNEYFVNWKKNWGQIYFPSEVKLKTDI
ncbi:lipopolysaccharide transport system ATP-binding protein [Salinimicrobium sediminis]|uniref:Lipopolysaccharide transport system ATP-binding protein n=1 Tax=Salinimicrobium sediminis TaxID=1343891 RepID=A0A285WZM5_9FLAO|nr:ABC transporter ATP-binding protein [Salinimicrobium sediminis]SOC78580.1 lipopolysaccharide transport system ATP-binding protein [Salinimicrobium sediminis]